MVSGALYTSHERSHVFTGSLLVVCECTHRFRKITGSVNAANLTIREQMPEHITCVFSGISVWKGLRFQKQKPGLTPHTHSDHPTTQPSTPPPPPTVSQPVIKICEEDVSKVFRRQKIRKAKGPDGVSPACLKACAVQLSSIFTLIFNRSLELCEVPSCFKRSAVMKSFERLVLAHLKDITGPLLDPLQFAYRANRSVDDAVNMGLHYILQHLDKPGTYARILFVDFSSAFNTIIPDTLQNKLTPLSVPTSICQWITSFLTDRQQLVRLGNFSSNTCTIRTGAPQGCVLSPLLFSLYTNDCTSKDPSVKLLKFADDTTLIGLIQDGDESAYRQEVKELAVWCSLNNLELNTLKTVEMIVDFRRNPPALPPLTIMNNSVNAVESFRFLETTISQDLKWDTHIDSHRSSTCHRRTWHSFTLLLLSRFCALL